MMKLAAYIDQSISQSRGVELLCSFNERAVELDGDAAPEELDGYDEEPFLGMASNKHAFDVDKRPPGDPYALPFPQIGVRKNREVAAYEPLDRVDLGIGDGLELVPPLAQH